MDNLAEEAIMFFIDNNDNPIPTMTDSNLGALLKTPCVCIVDIGHQDVRKIFTEHYSDHPQLDVCQLSARIYVTSETSVFPLLLNMNLTTFTSGFTPASFFKLQLLSFTPKLASQAMNFYDLSTKTHSINTKLHR